jgi:hypothetical protein
MKSKLSTKLLCLCAGALAALAVAAPIASAANPAPGYERFRGCPTTAEKPNVEVCVYSVVKSGNFKMGNKNVPISKPITITGGVEFGLSNFSANAEGGMKPVKQLVPGGVIGLTGLDWLVNFLSIEALQLYAVTEVVGQPVLGFETLSLPIRVHLINPALGNNCYVGSPANPIKLNLTIGTTSPPPPTAPISGVPYTDSYDEAAEVIKLADGTYVENAFAAPGASGCTLTLFGFIPISINGLVNSQSGLPAAAGTNSTSQTIDTELAPTYRVYP